MLNKEPFFKSGLIWPHKQMTGLVLNKYRVKYAGDYVTYSIMFKRFPERAISFWQLLYGSLYLVTEKINPAVIRLS